jgi:hypothetical protein
MRSMMALAQNRLPPALRLVATLLRSGLQRARRHAGGAIAVSVKARKVVADDFLRGIAFDPLGAGVPIDDESVRIEHEQRVIGLRAAPRPGNTLR